MDGVSKYRAGDEPVPGFRLVSYLGQGSFGSVWRATAPGGTAVAIKMLSLGMKGALKEFRALKLVKQIQHPNLVPILALWLKNEHGEILDEAAFEQLGSVSEQSVVDLGTVDYLPRREPAELTIAMGLGHSSLADRLKECQKQGAASIPLDELLGYLHDAARALDYLNSGRHPLGRAIQHCDIKPANLLIVGDAAQVCDFGLAREVDDVRKTSQAMSPVYAAPEIIETNVPSATTDQYSLAVSYFELRTGRLPFPPGVTPHTVIQAHLQGRLDWSELPAAECEVIKRATARRPSDRYPSTTAMVLALRDACYPRAKQSRGSWGTISKSGRYSIGDEPVPGYRLVSFLGSGGFGEVWKATAPGGTQVAIKINKLGMKGALKEFHALKLVKRIHYPNVIPILALWLKSEQGEVLDEDAFDSLEAESSLDNLPQATVSFEYNNRPEPAELIIAMGLGEKSLTTRLEECRAQGLQGIPVAELLKYFHDAARAIDFLNRAKPEGDTGPGSIQHCDIKPSNILIVGDAAQVCDFGLARRANDTRSTSLALSIAYAAPEMIETNVPADTTDQYSLAVSYVELRNGRLPFAPDAGAHTIVQAHLNGEIDLGGLSAAEQKVVRRATSRKWEDRYPTSTEFVSELHKACFPRAEAAYRGRGWWVAACLAAVIAVAGVAAWWTQRPVDLVIPASIQGAIAAAATADETVVDNLRCPSRLLVTVPQSDAALQFPLKLIVPKAKGGERIAPFYIMEEPVSRGLFQLFQKLTAAESPAGGSAEAAVGGGKNDPAAASGVEAARFACWLDAQLGAGGWMWDLPTAAQWDLAFNRAAPGAGEQAAPRSDRRPGPVGLAKTRPFSFVLLALGDTSGENTAKPRANGDAWREWTRTPQSAADPEFDKCHPDGTLYLLIRGNQQTEAGRSECAEDWFEDIGFRLVINVSQLH